MPGFRSSRFRRASWLAVAALAVIAIVATGLRRSDEAALEGSATRPPPLLAVAGDGADRRLVRLDPRSLRPLPGSIPLAAPARAGVWDPQRRRAAIMTGGALRLLDGHRMRTLATVRLGACGAAAAIAWPRDDRIWLAGGARAATTVVVVDPVRRRVIAQRRLAARLVAARSTPNGPVLLLAPPSSIGPAEVVTFDLDGRLARLRLGDVPAGVQSTDGFVHMRTPALAVDERGRRAYVVSVRSEIVEVDLQSLQARRRRPSTPRSLFDRPDDVVEARAEARPPTIGRERTATWLAPGLLAVSGRDADVVRRPTGALEQGTRPAGLEIVDTRSWRVRTLDPRIATVHAAADVLLVARTDPAGLGAYRSDGRRAFHVLDNERIEIVATAGPLAYVRATPAHRIHVVDVRRGAVIAERAVQLVPEMSLSGSGRPCSTRRISE